MKALIRFADVDNPNSFGSKLRRKRFKRFLQFLSTNQQQTVQILDVGGTEKFWEIMGFANSRHHVTLLNTEKEETHYPNIHSVVGDARQMSQFGDNFFNVAISNSVIEHVGPREDQLRMANEIRRVAVHYFIQTPNFYFPLEPHFLFPFFHWLPIAAKVFLLRHFTLGWYRKEPDTFRARALAQSVNLLTKSELQKLFPDAVIQHERFLGFTKSLLALRKIE
jgi:hypothetical protein